MHKFPVSMVYCEESRYGPSFPCEQSKRTAVWAASFLSNIGAILSLDFQLKAEVVLDREDSFSPPLSHTDIRGSK